MVCGCDGAGGGLTGRVLVRGSGSTEVLRVGFLEGVAVQVDVF